ncbi:hypothetical protein NOR51B_1903 [Luminiphilus syltensis NOR5-1B]|uniref:Uncharacterized protein n=2 Tax=Luminiphilus TaxID=1341118 RepID=B8KYH8_9GAMM|nr:hypothetical protein NOR51B_1903 [Luminiphilus syltensis NOR5-1B]
MAGEAQPISNARQPIDDVLPGDEAPDLEADSGWIRVELAVLVDDRPQMLESEQWPAYPAPTYPADFRWLIDSEVLDRLQKQHPGADIDIDENGRIRVTLPEPEPAFTVDPTIDLDEEGTPLLDDGLTNTEGAAASTEADEEQAPELVPLEFIDTGTAGEQPADASAEMDPESDSDLLGDEENKGENAPEYVPPPLPTAFMKRPLDLLASGLNALTRSQPDRLALSTAWVQPPESKNPAIVFDGARAPDQWPQLQGFAQLRRGTETRIGVNFWWSTAGDYLPDTFFMTPPPPVPERVEVIAPPPAPASVRFDDDPEVADPDAITGLTLPADRLPSDAEPETITPPVAIAGPLVNGDAGPLWPWRHVIHVADTRSVPEGQVRYFDHPVVKIVATFTELTWGEVYALGAADDERRAAAAALEEQASEFNSHDNPTAPVGDDLQTPPAGLPSRL